MLHRVYLLSKKKIAPVPPVPPVPYVAQLGYQSLQTTIYDYYGRVVALNDAGTQFFVGSDENSNTNSPNITAGPGRVYVYQKVGLSWSPPPIATLTASDGKVNDSFGQSLAVSGDGKTIVIGAPNATINGNVRQGAAYVFRWSATHNTWIQIEKLFDPAGTAEDEYGYSVSISRDGSTIAVGANKDDIIPTYTVGSVYVYTETILLTGIGSIAGTTLTVTSATPIYEYISVGTVISGAGIPANTKIVEMLTGTGGVGTYKISWSAVIPLTGVAFTCSTTWASTPTKLIAQDPKPDDNFGCSIALSSDGTNIVIGSSGSDSGATPNTGAVYYFTRGWNNSTVTYVQSAKVTSNIGVNGQSFGFSVDLDTTGTIMLVGAPFYDTGVATEDCGSVYVFKLINGVWVQRLRLQSADGVAGDRFGWSVAVGTNGKYFSVGAPGCDSGARESGATYIYVNLGTGWVQTSKMTEAPFFSIGPGDQFGYSTAITPDGLTAAAGAPTKGKSTGLPPPNTTIIHGAAYVFSQ